MKVLPPVRYRLIGLPGRAETEVKEDKWSRWLKDERWPDRRDPLEAARQDVRDHILELARLQWGEVVVDLGAGTGLPGLKAAPLVGPGGVAFFLDISRDSLESAASQATTGRECFVVARAERLVAGERQLGDKWTI